MQSDLIFEIPSRNIADYSKSLWELIQEYKEHILQVPVFQREFCWDDRKIAGWGVNIQTGNAIGVIVTYQIKGNGPIFLADGLQRLTATLKLLDDPQYYGLSVGSKQMELYVRSFSISVQHRHYYSHEAAMQAFQDLNKGTQASPYEYHRGSLTLDPRGVFVEQHVPSILTTFETPLFSGKNKTRERQQKLARDAYALFYQFITRTDRANFSGIGSSLVTTRDGIPIEQLLTSYFKEQETTIVQIEKWVADFEVYISRHYAQLRSVIIESGQSGKAMSPTFARWLLRVSLFNRNTSHSVSAYWNFVTSLIKELRDYAEFSSRLVVPGSMPRHTITLSLGTMDHLSELSKAVGHPNFFESERRKKTKITAVGFHESHVMPFKTFGNGATIIEPAIMNQIRGCEQIDSGEKP